MWASLAEPAAKRPVNPNGPIMASQTSALGRDEMGSQSSALVMSDSDEVWAGDMRTAEIANALRDSQPRRALGIR